MAKISVHYDGWVALPTRLRQLLSLKIGDELEVEMRGGELILRPVAEARASETADAIREPVSSPTITEDEPVPKRGRPMKLAVPTQSVKAAGRRKSADTSSPARKP